MLQDNLKQENITYYILQPYSGQALVIAKLLSQKPFTKLIAVLLNGDRSKTHKIYDEVVVVNSYTDLPKEAVLIPTAAQSTEALLKSVDIKLGNIRMSKKNLDVYDKLTFLKKCRLGNLPVPDQFEYQDLKENNFPIFFKQKNEKGGGVRGKANNLREVDRLPIEELVFQELIDSSGTYGVAFLARQGVVVTSTTHFEVESYPLSGGSATVIKKITNERLEELTHKFAEVFEYDGWGLAEYKYCPKRKDFVFMEVNAKFWASCYFSFANNPIFLKELFYIESNEKTIESLIFINRLLNTGLVNTIKTLIKYREAKIIFTSSIIRSIVRGILVDLNFYK